MTDAMTLCPQTFSLWTMRALYFPSLGQWPATPVPHKGGGKQLLAETLITPGMPWRPAGEKQRFAHITRHMERIKKNARSPVFIHTQYISTKRQPPPPPPCRMDLDTSSKRRSIQGTHRSGTPRPGTKWHGTFKFKHILALNASP